MYNFERNLYHMNKSYHVPLQHKVLLTIPEAAAYSGIGENTIDLLLREPNCTFLLYVGRKRLVKRKGFEDYLSRTTAVR
jgi:excisionase family DNA binding protein